MKNSKTVNDTTSKVDFRNATLTGFAKFKADLAEKQEKLKAEKLARKVVRTRSTHITLQNNVLLLIYNASVNNGKGITVAEIMDSTPVNCGTKTKFNIHTVNRDWNVEDVVQKETLRLEELGLEVGFDIDVNEPSAPSLKGKQNNRIKAVFNLPALKEFLLQNNVTEDMLKA